MNLNLAGYDLAPELLGRAQDSLDVLVRNRPDHVAVRLVVTDAVEDLYGNPPGSGVNGVVANQRVLPDVFPGRGYATATVAPRARLAMQELTRDHARFMFDPQDLSPPLLRSEQLYLAAQQVRRTGPATTDAKTPLLGPILVVPSPMTLAAIRPPVLLECNAPGGTKGEAGVSPAATLDPSQATAAPPLVLAMWQQLFAVTLRCLGPDTLLYSLGWGDPYIEVAVGDSVDLRTSIKYLLLAGAGSKPVKVAVQGWGFHFY